MLSDEESAELAELRRRAWGERPDLLEDEDALARLQELEDKARPDVPRDVTSEPRFDSLSSLDDPQMVEPVVERARNERPHVDPQEGEVGEDPVVERATNERDETRRDAPPERSPARRPGRGVLLLLGVLITVVALATGVRSILNPAPPRAAASPSPTYVFATPQMLPALACGDGWGPAGSLSTPAGKPVWSKQFDFPISETWVMPVRGARMVGVWANLDVAAGTISDVEVVSPTTARLFYTAAKTWSIPPSPDDIIANSRPSVVLPVCDKPDSYPGFILARAPSCVTLEFTIAGTAHYTVRTPVGLDEGAHCPTP
jgi:hypothetical protein